MQNWVGLLVVFIGTKYLFIYFPLALQAMSAVCPASTDSQGAANVIVHTCAKLFSPLLQVSLGVESLF